ncbi:hypothetical protein [Streptomyces sp. NPDC005009]
MSRVFADRFRYLAARSGYRETGTPFRILEMWEEHVDDCRDGYGGTLYEYENELSVRRFLQAVLGDPVIRETPEIEWFAAEVARIDEKFREILDDGFELPSGSTWWERRIPRVAGEEMSRDVKEHFGIEMEVT